MAPGRFGSVRDRAVFVLVLFLLFALLTGCAQDVSGTYSAWVDVRDSLNSALAAVEPGLSLSGSVMVRYVLALWEDGSYRLDIDTESLQESMEELLYAEAEQLVSALLQSRELDEDIYALIDESGGYADFGEFQDEIIREVLYNMQNNVFPAVAQASRREGDYVISGRSIRLYSGAGDSRTELYSGTIWRDAIDLAPAGDDGGGQRLAFKLE